LCDAGFALRQVEIINNSEALEYLFPVMVWSDIVGMRLDRY